MADQRAVIERLTLKIRAALSSSQKELAESVTKAYDEIMGRACDDLDKFFQSMFAGKGTLNYTDYKRLQMDQTEIQLLRPYLQGLRKETVDRLDKALQEIYWDSYRMNTWALDQTTPSSYDVTFMANLRDNPATNFYLQTFIRSQIMVPWKGAMFSERLGIIDDKMTRNIQTLTDNAMVNGWSVPDLSQAIRDEVGIPLGERLITRPRASAAKSRADMISRTEMMRATDLAKEKLYKDNNDLVKDERWLASELPNMCDKCAENDGKLISDLGERPPKHPRCTCCTIPVLKTWGELLGPQFAGMKDISIEEFEMKNWHYDGDKLKSVSVSVEPYDQWLEAQ